MADRALRYIQNHQKDDFFLTVSFDEPHGPSLCPPEYARMYQDYEPELTPAQQDTLENKPMYQKLWAQAAASQASPNRAPMLWGCCPTR